MPMLKEMTALTGGENPRADQINLLSALKYQYNYGALFGVLSDFCERAGLDPLEDVEVHEGFVSEKLARENGLEVQDEDSFTFRNLVFGIRSGDPEAFMTEAVAPVMAEGCSFSCFIKSVRLDKESGLFLMKMKQKYTDDTPFVLEIEEGGEVFVLEASEDEKEEEGETE